MQTISQNEARNSKIHLSFLCKNGLTNYFFLNLLDAWYFKYLVFKGAKYFFVIIKFQGLEQN